MDTATVRVKIENMYEDGHESTKTVELPAPVGSMDDWWDDVVWPQTGDGHGDGSHGKLGYCHTGTVVDASDPQLVGLDNEWVGR